MKSVKKNIIYNVLYQLLILIVPLITIPYISRILGADGVGTYSYTYSIAYYFMIISLLGINNYGNRTIAKSRDNKKIMSQNFWNIYFIQLFMSIIMIVLYILYMLIFNNQYTIIAWLQIFFIISSMFDINWFFFGIEEFKLTVTRNSILKIITLVLIFTLVKKPTDLWKYTLIMSASTLVSQLILWPFLLKKIEKIEKIDFKTLKVHFKQCLILFIPVIAVSLYKIMDKVMLGYLSDVAELGFYEQAEKIINVPCAIITALGTVMLPRISNLVANKNHEKVISYIEKSINVIMFLAFPMMFGIIAISHNFIPMYLGADFSKSATILNLLSVTIIFSSFANVLRTEYLLPHELDKIYIWSVIGGAIVNLAANFLLIPKYSGIGASIGTIFAEFFVFFVQSFALRKKIPIANYLKSVLPFFGKSMIMFLIVYSINFMQIHNVLIRILLQVTLGIVIYGVMNVGYIRNLFGRRFKK